MHCYLIGVSHANTPIYIREKIFFSEYKKIQTLEMLSEKGLDGVIILSTCNRCEIYISTDDMEKDCKIVKDFFVNYFNVENIDDYLFEKKDIDAITHIYRVAAGLDSMIVGEDQILGQVKDALENSIDLGTSSKYLNKLFREAITTAKKIKNKLKISENPISISYIAVKMLCEKLNDLKDKKIVVVGTGKIGFLTISYLAENGARNILCVNRSYDKVQKLIKIYPFIKYFDYDDRYNLIKDADILITSTTSPHTIIHKKDIQKSDKQVIMLDLSMPRDIENDVKNLKNVELYDIDSISKISEENIQKRQKLGSEAINIIEDAISEFCKWADNMSVDKAIKKLNEQCDIIYKDTMSYISRKVELNHREQKIVEKMLLSALKRMIKAPIQVLKQTDEKQRQNEYIKILEELFDIR